MKLTCHGAAKMVTGSNFRLQAGGLDIIIDCGLFQGSRYNEEMNFEAFPYDPSKVDYLLITHGHADHIGRVPKLYKDGFRGGIYSTEQTAALCRVALPDTMDKMRSEAREMGYESLYEHDDVVGCMNLFSGVPYRKPVRLNENVKIEFFESCHILGSAIIKITVMEDGKEKIITFSGDIGNPPSIILNNIDYVPDADYAVMESAYGDRFHEDRESRSEHLLTAVLETVANKGTLMIPSFAIERTQELLLELDRFFDQGRLPKVPFFVDSPLAIQMTQAYNKFVPTFNPEARNILENNKGILKFPWVTFTPDVEQSKGINDVPAPKIIIAGSGMSQGGRILHHEKRYLSEQRSMILFVGYQVKGSLGRRIMDGEKEVKIFRQPVNVHCKVRSIGAYSAHADQNGLVKYAQESSKSGNLKRIFVTQGEEEGAQVLAERIKKDLSIDAVVPEAGQEFEL